MLVSHRCQRKCRRCAPLAQANVRLYGTANASAAAGNSPRSSRQALVDPLAGVAGGSTYAAFDREEAVEDETTGIRQSSSELPPDARLACPCPAAVRSTARQCEAGHRAQRFIAASSCRAIRGVRIIIAGACRASRRSERVLLAAGASEQERRPMSRRAEPDAGEGQASRAKTASRRIPSKPDN